jgi:hypothetical protein
VFSRHLWTLPLKNKKAETVKNAFELLFSQTERRPGRILSDKGGEINNKKFISFLKENGVEYFHTNNPDTKCAIAERAIRTLRLMMQKIFTHRENYRYIDGVLYDVTTAYNNKYHRTIKMTPIEASDPNRILEVYEILYGKNRLAKKTPPKLKVGDHVRISREKQRFEKGHTWNWSQEVFTVSKVIPHQRPVYIISELDSGEEIEGHFYEWELNRVKKPDLFKIEYIVRTRGKGGSAEALVHWAGYPASNRSWIPLKDIVEL